MAVHKNDIGEVEVRGYHIALVSMVGALGLTSGAHAQPQLVREWSGFYLGGSLGAAEGSAKTTTSTNSDLPSSYFLPQSVLQVEDAGSGRLSQWKPSGGLFGGYGQQFSRLYAGVEVSVNRLGFDESRTSGASYVVAPASQFSYRQSVEADWQATLRARLGWAQDRWLAYVTGGAALSRIRASASFSDNHLGVGAGGRDANTDTRWGWVLGLGGEFALSDNWAIRGEYLYADYGKVRTAAVLTHPAFPGLFNTVKDSVEFRTRTVSLGLSYRF